MKIEGTVEDIIFNNSENGYTVMSVDIDGDLVTCVGKAMSVSSGESVVMQGEYVRNSRFGEQFSFSSIEVVEPKSIDSIVKYLSSGLIKGVGPVTALAIVNKFGVDTLQIIEYAPERLAEVRGISSKKAMEIGEHFRDIRRMQNAVIFLQQYDITVNLAVKIYNFYKDKTIDSISANPYALVEDIDGVGFLTADRIAIKMGISSTSPFRMRAGILHVLKDNSEKNAHTYLPLEELSSQVKDLLHIDQDVFGDLFEEELEKLQIEKQYLDM